MFTPSMYLTRTKTAVVAFAVFLPSIALGQAQPSTTFDKNGALHIAGRNIVSRGPGGHSSERYGLFENSKDGRIPVLFRRHPTRHWQSSLPHFRSRELDRSTCAA